MKNRIAIVIGVVLSLAFIVFTGPSDLNPIFVWAMNSAAERFGVIPALNGAVTYTILWFGAIFLIWVACEIHEHKSQS